MIQHIQVPHNMCEDKFLDPTDVLIYACLKRFMNNKTREAFPSLDLLEDKFGISKKTIIKSIKKLVEHEDISIRKRSRNNVYKFNPNNNNFEMFTFDFIEDKSKSVSKRAYLIMLHQSMMEKETGIGKISYSNKILSNKINLSTTTIRRRDLELVKDGILTLIPINKSDPETGLAVDLKLFDLEILGQSILYVNDRVDDHENRLSKIENLLLKNLNERDKEINRLNQIINNQQPTNDLIII